MWPTSVAIPVAVTTNSPVPRVTEVFMYTMSVRSPSGMSASPTGAVPFETGGSPRSARTRRPPASPLAAACRQPGTTSPASIETTSPGTSCSGGISASWPSRRTRAVTIILFWSAATAASASPSCCRPRTALASVSRISRMPVPSCLSGKRLRTPGREQHDLHRIGVLADEREPARFCPARGQLVGAEPAGTRRRLRRAQAVPRVCLLGSQHLLGAKSVPRGLWGQRLALRPRHIDQSGLHRTPPSRRATTETTRTPAAGQQPLLSDGCR